MKGARSTASYRTVRCFLFSSLLVPASQTPLLHHFKCIRLVPPSCPLCVAWETGQDPTHNVVRSTKLLLPDVRIWLDVDYLDDVASLERFVRESNTFLLFLSRGYYASYNW